MESSRQEYWNGLPFPSAGDLPDPGIEPRSPTLQADSLRPEPPGKPAKDTSKKPVEWEKLFINHIFDKGLLSKMYKELLQLSIKNGM